MTIEVLELPSSSSPSSTTSTARGSCKGWDGKCARRVHALGYCKGHYWRLKQALPVDVPITGHGPKKRQTICKTPRCGKDAHAKNLCLGCYSNAYRKQHEPSPQYTKLPATGQHCTAQDGNCGRPVKAKLLCHSHYMLREVRKKQDWDRPIGPYFKHKTRVNYLGPLRVNDEVLGQLNLMVKRRDMKPMEVVNEVLELWSRERVTRLGKRELEDEVERADPWARNGDDE